MYSELTTGKNSCCHYDLSQIIERKTNIYFPEYFMEDYFIDYLEERKIPFNFENDQYYVSKKDISWDTLYLLKTQAYSAINWYQELEEFTYKSSLIEINDFDDIRNILDKITFPKFIKLDTVSCKDVYNGIFNDKQTVLDVFKKSNRITNTLLQNLQNLQNNSYLFIREPDFDINKKIEARCFVYKRRLTAISSDVEIQCKFLLETFINKVIGKLPFHDAVLDICFYNKKTNNNFLLIEINNFGADSPCGAGLFNWREDYVTLYGGFTKVIYKFA